jgi:GTP-binding protein
LAVTKSDMLDDELEAALKPTLPQGVPSIFISSVSGKGIMALKDLIWATLNRMDER